MYWWAQLRNSLWRSAGTVFSLMLIFVWIQTPKEILQSWCEAGSLPEALPMPVTLMQPRCLSISQGVSKLCPFPLNFLGSWKFQGTQDCWFALKSLLSLCLSLSLNAVLLLSLSSLSLSLPLSLFHFFTLPASLLLSATLQSKHWQAMNQRGLFLLLLWECLQHTENSACGLTLCIFSEKLTGFQSQWMPVKPTQGFMYMSYTLGVCVDPHRPPWPHH